MRKYLRCILFVTYLFSAAIAKSAGPESAILNSTPAPGRVQGYQVSKGAGLTLEIAAGTAFCNRSLTHYDGGRLELTANATNYVYLDTSANCAPAASTKGFSPGGTPIATVFAGDSLITKIEAAPTETQTGPLTGTGGITSLNGLTASSQSFKTGTSGTNFAISSSSGTHTFNLPDASASARGLVSTGAQTFAGAKTFSTPISPSSGGTGANNAATAGLYLRGNGTNFVTSSVAAGGAGGCSANQFLTGTNDNAAPTCLQPAFSNLSGTAAASQLPAATSTSQGAIQLGSDIAGTAASPVVDGLQGRPVASIAPTTNQVLSWNGTAWGPATPNGGTVTSVGLAAPAEFSVSGSPVTTSGTLKLTKANQSANSFYAGPSSGAAAAPAFRSIVSADLPAASSAAQGAVQLAGDFAGSAAAPNVSGLQGNPVSSTAPTSTNQFLGWSGSQWAPTQPAFANLGGTASPGQLPGATSTSQGAIQLGSDIAGTAASPVVDGLQGRPVASTAPTTNQVLTWNGNAWAPATPSGGGSGLPSSWTVNSTTNAVTAQPASGQDAVPLSLAPNVASPTADLLDVYKDQGLTTKVLWIDGNGNLHFTGNDLSLGSSGQTMPSYAQVFGGGGNQPYLQLQTSDGTKNAYLSLSNTAAGVACISSSAPASDCAAGTQLPLLAQDLGGSATAPKVVGLQGNPVSSTVPSANQVLAWNGSAWAPATPSGGGSGSVSVNGSAVSNPNFVDSNGIKWSNPSGSTVNANAHADFAQTTIQSGDTVWTSGTFFATTYTIPANSLKVGTVVTLWAFGKEVTVSGAAIGYQVNLDSTIVLPGTGNTAAVGTGGWIIEGRFICTATGTSGTLEAQGYVYQDEDNRQTRGMLNTSAITIDTTSSHILKVGSTTGSNFPSGASTQQRQLIVTILP